MIDSNYIQIPRKDGSITISRVNINSATDKPLDMTEQLIAELYEKNVEIASKYFELKEFNKEMLEVLKTVFSMCPFNSGVYSVIKRIIEKNEGMK